MKRITMSLGMGILTLGSMLYAAVPQLINFQGILRDGSGNPVANGSYSVVFTIYDAPSGGTNLWSETQSVNTTSGLFTVLLGSVTPVPATAFDNPGRWLGIKVGADPEMTPRQRLSSVGYSYNSSEWTSAAGNLFRLNGNVGIGTSSPQRKLDVSGDGGFASSARILNTAASGQAFLTLQKTGGTAPNEWLLGLDLNAVGSARDFWIHDNVAGQTRLLINASGNVGIGTTAPDERLQVKNPGDDGAVIRIGGNSTSLIQKKIRFGDGDFLTVGESGVSDDRLEIKATAVGINTDNPSATLHVVGTAGNNTGVWSNLSDKRLKKDIEPIVGALETVEQLQGVTFHWKDAEKDAEFGRVRGLIAQDVEKVIPEWIKTDPDGYKRIEPIGVDALLIEAIKELKVENDELKNRIFKLEQTRPQAKVE